MKKEKKREAVYNLTANQEQLLIFLKKFVNRHLQANLCYLLLHGNIGSGKTTLAGQLAHLLGVPRQEISSPTFDLIHDHQLQYYQIFHCDFYRLKSEEELNELGLLEDWEKHLSQDRQTICLIEWPQLIIPSLAQIALYPGREIWSIFLQMPKTSKKSPAIANRREYHFYSRLISSSPVDGYNEFTSNSMTTRRT